MLYPFGNIAYAIYIVYEDHEKHGNGPEYIY